MPVELTLRLKLREFFRCPTKVVPAVSSCAAEQVLQSGWHQLHNSARLPVTQGREFAELLGPRLKEIHYQSLSADRTCIQIVM